MWDPCTQREGRNFSKGIQELPALSSLWSLHPTFRPHFPTQAGSTLSTFKAKAVGIIIIIPLLKSQWPFTSGCLLLLESMTMFGTDLQSIPYDIENAHIIILSRKKFESKTQYLMCSQFCFKNVYTHHTYKRIKENKSKCQKSSLDLWKYFFLYAFLNFPNFLEWSHMDAVQSSDSGIWETWFEFHSPYLVGPWIKSSLSLSLSFFSGKEYLGMAPSL